MNLLQIRFIQTPSGEGTNWIWVVAGLALVVGLIGVGALVSRARSPRGPAAAARYGRRLFRHTAKSLGLSDAQVDTLEALVRATKVRQPFLVFTNAGLLDEVLRRGLYSVDASRDLREEDRERRRAVIFGIKQTLEANARRSTAISSTHLVRPGQSLAVTPEGSAPFASKVVSNMKDFLAIQAPITTGGDRWRRGTQLSVYLWRENDAGYSFVSKILGYDSIKGTQCLLIGHSKTLRKEQRRRHRRRALMRACFAYPVRIVGDGRDRKAAIETGLRSLGTVVDLSAGGCAIQTMSPFEPGRLVMIEFDLERSSPIRAFGKVRRVRRLAGRGGVMHVMFTRVTQQYMNRISEFVYGLGRPRVAGEGAGRGRLGASGEERPAGPARRPWSTG